MPAVPEVRIASVGAEQGAAVRHLMDLAFNSPAPFDPDEPRFSEDRVVGAFVGDELVGTVMTQAFEQVFGGRTVRCGGLSGVTVAPHARGRGLARTMTGEAFARMRARGEVISALYPTASPLYRTLGYGVVGNFTHRRVPFSAVAPAPVLAWSPCDFGCADMRAIQRRDAAGHDGWIIPDDVWWDHQTWRRSAPPTDRVFSWLGRREGEAVATAVYTYRKSERLLYDLEVQLLAATDLAALRSVLSFLARNGSTAEAFDTTLPTETLDAVLHRPELVAAASDWPWMLRLVDLPGAIADRGYRSGPDLTLDLAVADPTIADNDGNWRLTVSGRSGAIERGGDGTIAVSVADLACIYGGVDPQLLHADGRLVGIGEDDLDVLAPVFATRPTLPTFF